MVVADRPLLDVESNPAGSHLFLVSSKELLYTAMAGFSFAQIRSAPQIFFLLCLLHPNTEEVFFTP